MYKEHLTLFKRLQLAADLLLVELAFVAAERVWLRLEPAAGGLAGEWLWIPPTAALVWLFFLDANGLYYSYRTLRARDLFAGIATSIAQGSAVLFALVYLVKAEVSRALLLLFVAASFAA